MRRIVLRSAFGALAICGILLPGCGGSNGTTDPNDDPDGFYIRFQAGGTERLYTGELLVHGVFSQVGSEYVFTADGVSTAGSITGGSIILAAMDVVPITTRTYGSYQVVGSGWTMGQILYSIGGVQYGNDDVPNDIQVTITEITATAVRGTFQGTLKASGQPNIAISSGEFYVKRAN